MFALVRYVQDSVFHICSAKDIKQSPHGSQKLARWHNRQFYPATILCYNDNRTLLENTKNHLSHLPIVEIDRRRDHEDLSISSGNRHTQTNDSFKIPATTLVHRSSTEENLMSVSKIDLVETRSNHDTIDATTSITSVAEVLFPMAINQNTDSNQSSDVSAFETNIPPPSDSFTTYPLDDITPTNKIIENKSSEIIFETSEDISFENGIVSVTEANRQSMDGVASNYELIINNEDVHNYLDDGNAALQDTSLTVAVDALQNETNHSVQLEDCEVRCLKRRKPIPLTYDRNVVVTPSHILNNSQVLDNITVPFATKSNSRKYFCIYCKKLYAKFPQHLQTSHRNEPAVNMYMLLPKKSAERRKIIETIRRRGDFVHNTFAEYNSGQLLVARRSKSQFDRDSKHYLPCPHCAAFFSKDTLRLHAKHCIPARVTGQKNVVIQSRSFICKLHPRASEFLKTKIFSILRDDDCVNIIRYDLLVILYGNYMCNKYSFQHHHDMIRNKLRSIGRLLITAKSLDSTIIDFANMLTPEKFDVTIASIKQVGGINAANTHYRAPTTVLTLSTVCKQACNIWKTECIKSSNPIAKQKVEDFLVLFNVTFPAELGRTAIENRVEQQRHKVVELPAKDDIIKLVSFLRRKRREWFLKVREGEVVNFKYAVQQLASYTLVSLMVFNRRRPGELERITLSDFANLQSAHTISARGGRFKENREEALLASRYKRFEIRGKLNRTVPVLVDFEIEACINLIIQSREKIGISSKNPYVFACPSVDHRHKYLRACFLLRLYSSNCGASKPDLLRATFLRKQIATECALNDLADNVIHDVASFMGHAVDIHNNIYRRPIEKRDILQMSKILELMQGDVSQDRDDPRQGNNQSLTRDDSNHLDRDKETTSSLDSDEETRQSNISLTDCLDDSELNDEDVLSTEVGEASEKAIYTQMHSSDILQLHQSSPASLCNGSSSDNYKSRKMKSKHISGLQRVCGPKRSWTPEERKAACEHFRKYLSSNKLPSIAKICKKLPFIVALKERSPTSVKTWLHNEMTRKNGKQHLKKTPQISGNSAATNVRTRWTPSMMSELKRVFANHFECRKLPSNSECAAAKDNFPDFQHLTVAAIKTAVANQLQRMPRV